MTGYQSKKAAALDEEGMYLVHHTQTAQVKVEGPLHVVCQCDKCKAQPAQEPVAWVLEWTYNGEEVGRRIYDDETHCKFDAGTDGGVCRPLVYGDTAPPAAPVQKPIEHLTAAFRALAPHCTMHDIARFREVCRNVLAIPPTEQREWVGLTDEEIDKTPCELYAPDQGGMTVEEGLQFYARAIEAKLKEKNT